MRSVWFFRSSSSHDIVNSLLSTPYLWRPFKDTGTIKNWRLCAYQGRQLLITPCRPIDPGKAWRTGENKSVESCSLAMSLRPVYSITEWGIKRYDPSYSQIQDSLISPPYLWRCFIFTQLSSEYQVEVGRLGQLISYVLEGICICFNIAAIKIFSHFTIFTAIIHFFHLKTIFMSPK